MFYYTIAEPADYIGLSAGPDRGHTFTPKTGPSRSVLVATVLDDTTEVQSALNSATIRDR